MVSGSGSGRIQRKIFSEYVAQATEQIEITNKKHTEKRRTPCISN
jgi:hypothetical protein